MIAPINRRFHIAPPRPHRESLEILAESHRQWDQDREWGAAFAAGVFVGLSVSVVILFVVLGLQ